MKIRALATFICFVSVPFASIHAQSKRPVVIDDIYRTQQVGNPQMSPDGKWIAYTVTTVDRDADKRRTSIWMVNWEGTRDVQLTSGANGDSSPRWSPDGNYLAFLSARPAGAKKQIWLLDRLGGEARQLTSVKDDIGAYLWSPDGSRIVLEMSASEDDALSPKAPKPIVIDRYHFKHDVDGYLTASSRARLYLFEVKTKKLEPLTTDKNVRRHHPVWSPDGTRIAYISNHEKEPDQTGTDDIFVIEARPGAVPAKIATSYSPNGQHLSWSPDGKLIAFLRGAEPKYDAYKQDSLIVVPVAGGAPRVLGEKFDRSVHSPEFTQDGSAITVLVPDDRRRIHRHNFRADGSTASRIRFELVVTQRSTAGGHTATLASGDALAPEIFALEDGKLRKLTSHNDALLSELQLGAVEDISFKSKDGTEVHGMMIKPPDLHRRKKISHAALDSRRTQRPGRSQPALQHLSASARAPAFRRPWLRGPRDQLSRQQRPRRGICQQASSPTGATRKSPIYWRPWISRSPAALPIPQRLGIGGWSYGGMLTDYTIATDSRFKAAVSGAGLANAARALRHRPVHFPVRPTNSACPGSLPKPG